MSEKNVYVFIINAQSNSKLFNKFKCNRITQIKSCLMRTIYIYGFLKTNYGSIKEQK